MIRVYMSFAAYNRSSRATKSNMIDLMWHVSAENQVEARRKLLERAWSQELYVKKISVNKIRVI